MMHRRLWEQEPMLEEIKIEDLDDEKLKDLGRQVIARLTAEWARKAEKPEIKKIEVPDA